MLTKLVGLLFGALILQVGAFAAAETLETCDLDMIRLPESFVPNHYDLRIEPNLDDFTFEGEVDIHVTHQGQAQAGKCNRAQRIGALLGKVAKNVFVCGAPGEEDQCDKRIVLNVGKSIRPTSIEVYSKTKSPLDNLALGRKCLDRPNQMLLINLSRRVKSGEQLHIRIKYTGVIGDESRGFFKSQHVNPADSTKYTNANTHFFPADARSAYPSFDEPDFKATFSLNIKHKPEMSVVSNSPVDFHVKMFNGPNEYHVTTFKKTPKMSTYNFAFAVGRYDKVTCSERENVQAYVPVGRIEDSQFILDTICKAINVGERYFNNKFPLEKLDIVVTKQMRDPSRENWGMLVITEDFMFVNKDTTNVLRAEITKLAVHVVLHQWWGDLVTAKWWDDQWIFDGFTIWQSHWSTAKLYPELDYDFNYLLRLQSPMLDAHANSSVHAIKTYQALDADQELALFDANTFNKAGAVYQTLDSAFQAALRRGLVDVVNSRAYGTVDAKDYFDIVGKAVDYNLEPMLRSWLDQRGFPLVEVKLSAGRVKLTQSRLVDQPGDNPETWVIPIKYSLSTGKDTPSDERIFMSEKERVLEMPFSLSSSKPDHWIKLNTNFGGFYRVKYEEGLLRRLRAPVENKVLPPADRFNIIDDLRALLKLGRVEVSLVEEVLNWYTKETSGGVISGLALVVPILSAAHKAAGKDSSETQKIVFSLFEHVFEESKFEVIEGERHAEMNGRQDALLTLVAYNHQPTIDEALKVFDSSDVHLTPFLRKPVYLAVINHGSDAQFEQFVQRLRDTSSLYERQVLVASLAPYATNKERAQLASGTLVP